eukprot:scaffold58473_cov26-Prasinocladus_malaysianus.AAC.1
MDDGLLEIIYWTMGCAKLFDFQRGEGLHTYILPQRHDCDFAAPGCAFRALLEPKTQTEMRAPLGHLKSNGLHSGDSMVLLNSELANS